MLYFHSWSGGKDSTAAIILDHIHGLPPSEIVISEVMFSHERNISGELPEHIDFIYNTAIPKFKEWGYTTHVVKDERDFLYYFYHIITQSSVAERNGKRRAFPLGGMCHINPALKKRPLRKFFAQYPEQEFIQYVGIAVDEPKRIARLDGTNKVSLLQQYRYTEKMAFDLCKEYGLLSPIYEFSKRGGCWFCPNQTYEELARLKYTYPALWEEIVALSKEDNLVSEGFKYGQTVAEVERQIDAIIQNWELEKNQMNIFDFLEG